MISLLRAPARGPDGRRTGGSGARLARVMVAVAALAAGAAVAPRPAQAQQDRAVAIVVHPSVPVSNMSFAELRRVFLAERRFWPDRSKITLLIRAPTAFERDMVLDRIYRMSEDQFRQYWIAKIFRAEIAAEPKIVYSTDMAHGLVNAIPGAITFMPAASVGDNTKVVRIDGKLPGDPGYPLR